MVTLPLQPLFLSWQKAYTFSYKRTPLMQPLCHEELIPSKTILTRMFFKLVHHLSSQTRKHNMKLDPILVLFVRQFSFVIMFEEPYAFITSLLPYMYFPCWTARIAHCGYNYYFFLYGNTANSVESMEVLYHIMMEHASRNLLWYHLYKCRARLKLVITRSLVLILA